MAQVAKRYQDDLKDIQENVRNSYKYFRKNREYFNNTRRFVLETNLNDDDKHVLDQLNRPILQFNTLEAYESRLLGEYSKQQASIEVFANPTDNPPDPEMVEYIEGHMRAIFQQYDSYEVYRDQLTGGYSAIKLSYDYENDLSFNHKIEIKRVYDPLLCGWDETSREKHKGDGQYCYELFPLTEDDIKEMNYDIDVKAINPSRDESGFQWCYKIGDKKIIMVCDFYKKKKKRIKIFRLSDNSVRTEAEYKRILDIYEKKQIVPQAPSIIGARYSMQTTICRYRFVQDQVISYSETAFPILPIVFVDGNSVLLKDDAGEYGVKQVVKGYTHNATDAQRLMNLSGQQLANSIQTIVEHKMKIALESVPKGYESSYFDVQYPGNYIFKAYTDDGRQLPPPQEVTKMPIPPEVVSTFMGASQLIQNILGSYDAQLGINKTQLSGVAIVEGATQSNATAMPYIVNLLASLQQVANGIIDLIPKLYVTPRSIPIVTAENKRAFVLVNTGAVPQNGKKFKNTKPIRISYNVADLGVTVKPGVNFEVQKQRALETLISLSQALPAFASIVNGQGLPILCDNLEIRGADRLKVIAEQQVQMQQAQQQQQQQQQQQGSSPQFNPAIQNIALQQQKLMLDNQNKQAEIQLKQVQLQNERMKINADYASSRQDNAVQLAKVSTERAVHAGDLALRTHDQLHRHTSDAIEHAKDLLEMGKSDLNQASEPMSPQPPDESE